MSVCDYIIVGPAPPYRGGISNHTTELATVLKSEGPTEVVTFRLMYPGPLFPGRTQYLPSQPMLNFPVRRLLSSVDPVSWWKTAEYLCTLSPQGVIFQWWHPFFAPAYATIANRLRRMGIPVVYLCHNVEPHESTVLDRLLLEFAYNPVSRFVTQSQRERSRLLAYKPRARISVNIHPEYPQFPDPPEDLSDPVRLPTTELTLLFFGLVREYKGLQYLLEAMPAILREIDAHLVIAGEFYENPEYYQSLIQRLGIEEHVTVVNEYIPDTEVGWYFKHSDLVVLPYISATQSGIIPLAYHFRTPVVATDVGGLSDVIRQGKTGYLIPPQDHEAVASAVKQFHHDRQAIDFTDAIEEILPMFSWERLRSTVLDLLAEPV